MVRPDYGVPVGDGTLDLPGPLGLGSALPFVGRSGELARLSALLPLAVGAGQQGAAPRQLAGAADEGQGRAESERPRKIEGSVAHGHTIVRSDHGAPHPACLLYTSPSPRDGLLSRMP